MEKFLKLNEVNSAHPLFHEALRIQTQSSVLESLCEPSIKGNVPHLTGQRDCFSQVSAVYLLFLLPVEVPKSLAQSIQFPRFHFTLVLPTQLLELIEVDNDLELLQVADGVLRSYFVLKGIQTQFTPAKE